MKNRKSIRLRGYDYSAKGMYFVTVDVQDKLKLFWDAGEKNGKQKGGHTGPPVQKMPVQGTPVQKMPVQGTPNERESTQVKLNDIGQMIGYWWGEIGHHFENIIIDEFVVIPDHFHGILIINNNFVVGADRCVGPKLGNVIQWFKTMTTNEYIKNGKLNNWPRFNKRLWQRNYFERVIRDRFEYDRVKKYIINNPVVEFGVSGILP
jgi:putative transposase